MSKIDRDITSHQIFMNRIEKLNEQSDIFHNDKELISLDNEVTPNLVVSSSTSYENSSSNPNE